MQRLSLIIPLYNRPDEIRELLESLRPQAELLHEIIVVEDGSNVDARSIVDAFSSDLPTRYFFKPNSGPGQSRNYGAERANGDYLIFLDSDCVIPEGYLEAIHAELAQQPVDAFGGPDRAHHSFTPLQKAINYAMTSFFTTGGIRGKVKSLDTFYPRSFNMGYSQTVFERTKGFGPMRFGEDIDMSLRLIKEGFSTRLFPEAYVYHKRRTNFRQFFKQVFNSGMARIHLHLLHPGSLKLVHLLPAVFTLGTLGCLLLSFVHLAFLTPLVFYAVLIGVHSSITNKSLGVGLLSIPAAFIQLIGYGLGFFNGIWVRIIRKKNPRGAFVKHFYD
jgi:glycosyltransferase involved in cell wall biosynthesis